MGLCAADVMTTKVVTVAPETRVSEIAGVLTKMHVSSVPVCQPDGTLVGIVSEQDILKPFLNSTKVRREKWLTLIAEGENLSQDFLSYIEADPRTAHDVMHLEVQSATETTPIVDLAETMTSQKVRHIPILRDGRIVGIVSRADLVAALAKSPGAMD